MLAGDVLAAVVRGNLMIQGDAAANEIAITDLGGGNIQVAGLNGTTVNGQSAAQSLAGVRFGVKAELNAGDDKVSFDGNATHPLAQVKIETGLGNDTISVDHAFAGLLKIESGGGDDVVKLLDVTSVLAAIETGAGDDQVRLGDASVRPDATLRAVTLKIDTGLGNDAIIMEDVIIDAVLTKIDTGLGDDSVAVNGLNAKGLVEFETGGGTDSVSLTNSTFTRLVVDLGAGDNDLLTIVGTKSLTTRLQGGPGTGDQLSIATSDLGSLRVSGFEIIT